MGKTQINQIKPNDQICYNCRYIVWLTALGQGLRCSHPTTRVEGKLPPLIPSMFHTCELFESKSCLTKS